MGCRCVVVPDGSEAIGIANGDVRFDVIMLDLNMPISEKCFSVEPLAATDLRE